MGIFRKKMHQKDDTLLREIETTRRALEAAYSTFENVLDPDLIDCSIYEVNAIQQRYRFLIKQAKREEGTYSVI